jgi:hypothetical protein
MFSLDIARAVSLRGFRNFHFYRDDLYVRLVTVPFGMARVVYVALHPKRKENGWTWVS